MANIRLEQRGVASGIVSVARSLGLITGAAAMGAVFASSSAVMDATLSGAAAIAAGMRITFALSAILMTVALALTLGLRRCCELGQMLSL
jgi:hypothetical protein